MSIIRNRELSQFGSFIFVENSSQKISITSETLPYVGIGTTNPTTKLDVSGTINAGSFSVNGVPLLNPVLDHWQETNTNDIYRLTGNVGIGNSIPSEKLEVKGNIKASRFISTETTLPPFSVNSSAQVGNLNVSLLAGKSAPSGNIVGTTDNQILTNKELTSPTIGGGVIFKGSSSGIVSLTASSIASGVLLLPSVSGIATLITQQSVGVITTGMILDGTIKAEDISTGAGITYGKLSFNSSLGSGIINSDIASNAAISYSKLNLTGSIKSSDISSGAGITNGQLANSTISGVGLGSDLKTLTFGTYFTGNSYNGSSDVTLGLNASSSDNSGNTVVVRSNGGFSAGNVYVSSLNSSGIVTGNSFYVDANPIITNSKDIINVRNANFTGIVSDISGNVRNIPQNSQSNPYTLQSTDVGKHVTIVGSGVTVPANIFNPGDAITIYNNSGVGNTITQGSGVTLRFSGTTSTGNRTILPYGIANILCVSSNTFVIAGIIT